MPKQTKRRTQSKKQLSLEDYQAPAASLQQEAHRRYLTYAMSVITSRALPDVRDGLKPVHRRVLFAMWADEHLYPTAKHRKSAKVVGSVIGRYHPHGDVAAYEAMVRMAQPFSLREPLVEGSGNFGSIDGDSAAAYRYTECRLMPIAMELLTELKQNTVLMRPNYDATTQEPVVLPARFPNLLVNGATGIAVGLATHIPPHNLNELINALVALIDNPKMTVKDLLSHVKGPDFPMGGQLITTKETLLQCYQTGQGALPVRSEYSIETPTRGMTQIVITSIPYAVTTASIVEKTAELVLSKKLMQIVDIRDESTTKLRLVIELKKGADVNMVMSYLYKHTPLQTTFHVNLTCLVPSSNEGEVSKPKRLNLKEMLSHYLDARYLTIRKRLTYQLETLKERCHILEGFGILFNDLDKAIAVIRKSGDKTKAAKTLIAMFKIDELQADAILELKLYKISKLEIQTIRDELRKKQTEIKHIESILKSKTKFANLVKKEFLQIAEDYGNPRRTKIKKPSPEKTFDSEDYIIHEDAQVIITHDMWIKRVRESKDPINTRLRSGDSVMAVLPGSTKSNIAVFTNIGYCYVTKINNIPSTTGHGDPIQKLFRFKDKERIIAAFTLDPRADIPSNLLVVSKHGYGFQCKTNPNQEDTTKAGRRYAKPAKNDEIAYVVPVTDKDIILIATTKGHVLQCKANTIKALETPGKGVRIIHAGIDNDVIAFVSSSNPKETLTLKTSGGKTKTITPNPNKLVSRGGKGTQIVKRETLKEIPPAPYIVSLKEPTQ